MCKQCKCGKSFVSETGLKRHKLQHSSMKHKCPVCDKEFAFLLELSTHQTIHSDEKKFVCQYPRCNGKYMTKAKYHRHYKTHRPTSNDYICPVCNKAFCKPKYLKLFSPVSVFLGHSVMEFLSLQEGLLCCSVESLHFTICLGMIGTGDVMSNVGQLIEFLTDLKNKILGVHKIKFIKKFLGIHEITFIKNILGHTLYEIHVLILNAQECTHT